MKKSRFTETEIIGMLKEAETGIKITELCRKYAVSEATFYKWRSKYSGMEASDVKRMKALEEENRRLKHLYADLSLENYALKDLLGKK